jgi:hypothetical protein
LHQQLLDLGNRSHAEFDPEFAPGVASESCNLSGFIIEADGFERTRDELSIGMRKRLETELIDADKLSISPHFEYNPIHIALPVMWEDIDMSAIGQLLIAEGDGLSSEGYFVPAAAVALQLAHREINLHHLDSLLPLQLDAESLHVWQHFHQLGFAGLDYG